MLECLSKIKNKCQNIYAYRKCQNLCFITANCCLSFTPVIIKNICQKNTEVTSCVYLICVQEKDSKLSELESENRKMKVELEEFRTESTHLKNQQATIRRLEERCRQLEQQVIIFMRVSPFFLWLLLLAAILAGMCAWLQLAESASLINIICFSKFLDKENHEINENWKVV